MPDVTSSKSGVHGADFSPGEINGRLAQGSVTLFLSVLDLVHPSYNVQHSRVSVYSVAFDHTTVLLTDYANKLTVFYVAPSAQGQAQGLFSCNSGYGSRTPVQVTSADVLLAGFAANTSSVLSLDLISPSSSSPSSGPVFGSLSRGLSGLYVMSTCELSVHLFDLSSSAAAISVREQRLGTVTSVTSVHIKSLGTAGGHYPHLGEKET